MNGVSNAPPPPPPPPPEKSQPDALSAQQGQIGSAGADQSPVPPQPQPPWSVTTDTASAGDGLKSSVDAPMSFAGQIADQSPVPPQPQPPWSVTTDTASAGDGLKSSVDAQTSFPGDVAGQAPVPAQTQPPEVSERLKMAAEGVANIAIAVGEGVALVAEGAAAPETGGLTTVVMGVTAVHAAGNLAAGVTQVIAAAAGAPKDGELGGKVVETASTLVGVTTLAVTGDLDTASHLASAERIAVAGVGIGSNPRPDNTGEVIGTVSKGVETVMNLPTVPPCGPVAPPAASHEK
jgi:hypothetical protein